MTKSDIRHRGRPTERSFSARYRRRLTASVLGLLLLPMPAHAVVNDPQGSGPILAALEWLQGTLLGNVATTVAVIAVAFIGFLMLTGRMNWRFGATVVVGCFILFGATAIVAGIQAAVGAAN